MREGYVKLWRKIKDDEIMLSPGLLQLWVWLLTSARHEPGKVYGIELQAGQLITGKQALARALNIPPTTAHRRLRALQNRTMVGLKTDRKWTVVTICNWDTYNGHDNNSGPQSDRKRTAIGPQPDPKKNERMKEERKIPPISPQGGELFERFWQAYPRKVGKGAARKAWSKLRSPATTLDAILAALEWQRSSEQWTRDHGQYVPHPATYLNQGRWEDEPEQQTINMEPKPSYHQEFPR